MKMFLLDPPRLLALFRSMMELSSKLSLPYFSTPVACTSSASQLTKREILRIMVKATLKSELGLLFHQLASEGIVGGTQPPKGLLPLLLVKVSM